MNGNIKYFDDEDDDDDDDDDDDGGKNISFVMDDAEIYEKYNEIIGSS